MTRAALYLAGMMAAAVLGPAAEIVAGAGDVSAVRPGRETEAKTSREVEAKTSREVEAIAFARRHHPELAELLKRLKANDGKAYERAIRDVAQASDRLLRLRENDSERYELGVKVWTLDSRIRLLAARASMSDDPAIEDQLRDLLRERRDARLAALRLDRQRTAARLDKLDEQIDTLEQRSDDAIETDLTRLRRAVEKSPARRRTENRKGIERPAKMEVDRDTPSRKAGDRKAAIPPIERRSDKASEKSAPAGTSNDRGTRSDDADKRREN